ncbi:MAG: hypothetical protein HC933_11670 [Pleurocapsa sp. SU_196_0]|nr:hypothetical protein [Pleurocapsa sp. SU_196_0]
MSRGLLRVHYGVDYVNDDGSPADYAVLEYADGRIEELDEWLEDLEYDTFLSSVRYCYPYTFDARNAEVSFDASGGMMDTEENVIRMYHTDARRACWKSKRTPPIVSWNSVAVTMKPWAICARCSRRTASRTCTSGWMRHHRVTR